MIRPALPAQVVLADPPSVLALAAAFLRLAGP
jgi:hypothetical protein